MNILTFGAPHWFWCLLIIPFLVLFFLRAERRGARRIQEFVSERLLPRLAGTVNRFRRGLKFSLLLCSFALAITALAQPRWGYTYDDTKRKGLDLILAVDTSRSMLSNDLAPNRLERVKLATQDLVNELQGDRVGLIAFAGRAFLQAPLTIDYGAAVEAINDLDTNTIPEGGSNISEAINLAVSTYGKSAVGNRALIIFTDGEELSGDATRSAKAAADAGVHIFTVGVGTPEGSLIPISGEGGGTAFVKDSKGQVVKSKLDETRLREIAEATNGVYLRLESGPGTMKRLIAQGLGKMKAGEIDARLARLPIERYEWPLGAALLALAASILISDRRQSRKKRAAVATVHDRRTPATNPRDGHRPPLQPSRLVATVIGTFLLGATAAHGSAPGLDAYRQEKFPDAYQQFQKTLQENPQTHASDKIQFDSGAAAYKMKDYNKALESFSQALLSRNAGLQSNSHYNLGNTLYQRGDAQKADDKKLTDWNNALQHYDETLKLNPQNKEAKENREFVKKKIDELKSKQEQPTPTPTPSPSPSPSPKQDKDEKKQDKQQEQQKDQQKQSQDQKDQKKENQESGEQQKPEDKNSEGKDGSKDQSKPGESPSPSPGESPSPSPSPGETPSSSLGQSPSPSPSENSDEKKSDQTKQPSPAQSSTPSDAAGSSPTPSPGEGNESGAGASPTPSAAESPSKKLAGEVKGANDETPSSSPEPAAQAEEVKEGEMSEKQAERLLQSMKDEERRVQLD
ncbi:MAG: VWA domain-containing protein, partial [Verrucomicrobiota bacterium]